MATIEEAVTVYQELAGLGPAVVAGMLRNSLNVRAQILSALGRSAEAQAVRDEAAAVRGAE
jgi:hypothetical protein